MKKLHSGGYFLSKNLPPMASIAATGPWQLSIDNTENN